MGVSLQAVVSLDTTEFHAGLGAMQRAASNAAQALMAAFGGAAGEVLALGRAFGAVGAAVGILKESVTAGQAFEQQLANVRTVTGLTADAIAGLGVEAREFARTTRYSAEDVGKAMYGLGSAGIASVEDLMSVLKPAMTLASATLGDTTEATETLTSTLQNLRMPFSDAAKLANLFAGTIAATPANMSRLSEAMKYAAPVAGALKISLEELVLGVGALHVAGLKGEMAGTAFRMALIDLTEAAAKGGTKVGSAMRGWTAETEGLTGAIKRLEAAGVTGSEVMTELGARGGTGIAALLNMGSAAIGKTGERIREMSDIAKMAGVQMDTVQGQFRVFVNTLQEIGLVIYDGVGPAVRALVDELRQASEWALTLTQNLTGGQLAAAWDQIATAGESAWSGIKVGAIAAFEAARLAAGEFAGWFAGQDWSRNWDGFRAAATGAFEIVRGAAVQTFGQVRDFLAGQDWGAVWVDLKDGFAKAVTFILELRTKITEGIREALAGISGEDVAKAFRGLVEYVEQFLPDLEAAFVSTWGAIREAGRIAIESLRIGFEKLVDVLRPERLGDVFGALKAAAGEAVDALVGLFDQVPAGIRAALGDAAEQLKGIFAAVSDAARSVVDVVVSVGQALAAAAAAAGMGDWATGTLGKLAGILANVLGVIRSVAADVASLVGLLAELAGSPIVKGVLTVAFEALAAATTAALWVVEEFTGMVRELAAAFEALPGPIQATLALLAGAAGLKAVLPLLVTGVAALIPALKSLGETLVLQALYAKDFFTQGTSLKGILGSLGQAGAVAGAAFAGWQLGKLIRELPGVAAWMDNLAEKIWKLTGLMVEQDPALEARVNRLRAERQALEESWNANNAAAAGVAAHGAAAAAAAPAVENLAAALTEAKGEASGTATAAGDAARRIQEVGSVADSGGQGLAVFATAAEEAAKQTSKTAAATGELRAALTGLKDVAFDLKIALPKLDSTQVNLWRQFLEVLKSAKSVAVSVAMNLPKLSSAQVNLWKDLLTFLRQNKDLAVSVSVALPKLSSALLNLWREFFKMLRDNKDLDFKVNVSLPKLSSAQVALWKEFFSLFKDVGGADLKMPGAPKLTDLNANLGKCAAALEKLVEMKGVVWA